MIKELITNGNMTINESPDFVLLPNNLNEKELHLLLLLVAQVKEDDKEFNWIEMEYDTLINRYNQSNKYSLDSVESMKNAIHKLAQKLWKDEVGSFRHYLEKGDFDDTNRIVRLKLSDEVICFFLQLGKYKLTSKYGYIKSLRTKCAMQLYRWCNLKKNLGNAIPIKIEDAIRLFYDNEKEITANHFFNKHLNPAIQKINELTDLHVEYEKIKADKKDKRKITSLRFTICETCAHDDSFDMIDFDYFD